MFSRSTHLRIQHALARLHHLLHRVSQHTGVRQPPHRQLRGGVRVVDGVRIRDVGRREEVGLRGDVRAVAQLEPHVGATHERYLQRDTNPAHLTQVNIPALPLSTCSVARLRYELREWAG